MEQAELFYKYLDFSCKVEFTKIFNVQECKAMLQYSI